MGWDERKTLLSACLGSLSACLILLSAQSPAALDADVTGPDGRFELGLVEALARMEKLAEAEDFAGAKKTGHELLALRSFDAWRATIELDEGSWWNPVLDQGEVLADVLKLSFTDQEEAHVHYALGVVALGAQEADDARSSFGKAASQAGPGGLREDAMYNSGTMELLAGEAWRSQIPELGGSPPAPPVPTPGAAAADPEEAPDPLEEARQAYLAARASFILRLQLDWHDADTRANMELVMRRLRELDEIERQREEKENKEEPSEDEKSEESESDDQDSEDKEKKDGEEESEPDESDESQEGAPPEEPEEPEGSKEPEPTEEEETPEETEQPDPSEMEEQDSDQAPPEAQQEIYLTKEEVQRLLDRLKEYEQQGQELRDRKRRGRRPMARDW